METKVMKDLQSVIDSNAHAIALCEAANEWYNKEHRKQHIVAQTALKRAMAELVRNRRELKSLDSLLDDIVFEDE